MHGARTRGAALAAWLLAALALLGGCAAPIHERPMADVSEWGIAPGVAVPLVDGYAEQQAQVTLYGLSADGERLTPVTHTVTMTAGESLARAALGALLDGTAMRESGLYWPLTDAGAAAQTLELSDGVATMSLPARCRALEPQTLYAVRAAIAATLTELGDIDYVNVLVDGREEGLDLAGTLPLGTLSREEELDVLARYNRLDDQRQSGAAITRLTTLYFPARGGAWVLPVVRAVAYDEQSPIEYLYTLLEELGKGTAHALAADAPAPLDYLTEMPDIVRTQDGANRAIDIRFSAALDDALLDAGLTRGVYLAMLTDTLMGFVPGVEGLRVRIGEETLTGLAASEMPGGRVVVFTQGLATRAAFAGMIGAPVTLYAAAPDGRLTRVQTVLSEANQRAPRAQLGALLALAQGAPLPAGLSDADILAMRVEADCVAVNLSEAFGQALAALDAQTARTAVYAMVNTLTQGRAQQKVVFFFDGEQMETPLGDLDMRGNLLRNPGMVVRTNGSSGVL